MVDVTEVVEVLPESIEQIRALRGRNQYLPEGGSPAHRAWIALSMPERPPSFHAYSFASSQIGAAEDHLLALAALLEDRSFSLAPYVLARAAIEASGRAFLLLDSRLDERERAEWAVAEKLHDLRTLERLMRSHDPQLAQEVVRNDVRDVRGRVRGITRGARHEGLRILERPSFTAVVRAVMNPEDASMGAITAAAYSAIAHAAPETILAMTWALDNRLGHEWGVGSPQLDDSTVVELVVAGAMPYFRAVSRQVDAYGWPPSSWRRWVRHARVVLRKALRDR